MPSSASTRAQVGPTADTITPKRKASRSLFAAASALHDQKQVARLDLGGERRRRDRFLRQLLDDAEEGRRVLRQLPLVDELVQRRGTGAPRRALRSARHSGRGPPCGGGGRPRGAPR